MLRNWSNIKEKIYFEDGSLRDILVHNTSLKDWQDWGRFVINNYNLELYDVHNSIVSDKEKLSHIFHEWGSVAEEYVRAKVQIGGIILMCYIFDNEIEGDINPREIRSIEDHNNLIGYMIGLSKVLEKEVILTAEMSRDNIYIRIDKDNVSII